MRTLFLALAIAQTIVSIPAATYRVGDTVTNFTFVARLPFTRPDGSVAPAGSPVQLSDFTGRIVFLEWFAVWCPFCVAAAPQVKEGIADWYEQRGGNPQGVPVLHVAVNQESASFYQTQTDNFVKQHGLDPVVNDYDATTRHRVRALFQNSGQPVFVVINGVTNSPSHQPWQLLVNHLGYGERDFNQELANFRAIIDTVQPGAAASPADPPRLGKSRRVGPHFEFEIQTQPGRMYQIQGSTNLSDWATLFTFTGSNTPILFRDTNAPSDLRSYRAVTP